MGCVAFCFTLVGRPFLFMPFCFPGANFFIHLWMKWPEYTNIHRKPRGKLKIRGKIYIQVSRSGLCIQHCVWTWPSKATPSSSFVDGRSCDVETRMRSYTTFEKETFKRNKLEPGLTHGQWVKNLPAVQETQETWFDPWVWQIPWRKKWQPTPVFLPVDSPWIEELGRLQSMGSQRVGHDWVTNTLKTGGFPGSASGKEPTCQCVRD